MQNINGSNKVKLKEKLIENLQEMFRIDTYDLDFGIYKILKYKQTQITNFINNDLIRKIDAIGNAKSAENIYRNIINFFARYYENGDFIPKRKYSRADKYYIPHSGEEVSLYWVSKEQYYIKNSERFNVYSWQFAEKRIVFQINKETTQLEKSDIKTKKNCYYIFLNTDTDANQNIFINFSYREITANEEAEISKMVNVKTINQREVNTYNMNKMRKDASISSVININKKYVNYKGEESKMTELEWHLNRFTQKNKSDFFIHKDLKQFLFQELDFYIKNEFCDLRQLLQKPESKESEKNKQHEMNEVLNQLSVFTDICGSIIEFLTQIENFQKILWEKPKMVISTDYIITVNHIDESIYPEIINNQEQIEEWKKLNVIGSENELGKRGIEYLKKNPTLPVDTKFFDAKMKWQIIGQIENLEEKLTGIMINSDNFHALKLLQTKYFDQIKCCYIDPPYNIAGDEFIYKDNFRDSSWLTLMENRLELCKRLLSQDGIFFSSIDDAMVAPYSLLIESIFPEKLKNIIWHKKTQPSFLTNELIPVTEYVLVAKNSTEKIEMVGGFGNPDKHAELLNISNRIDKRTIPKESVNIKNGWTGTLAEKLYGKDELKIELMNAPVDVVNGKPNKDLELSGRFKWTQERIQQEIHKGGKMFIKSTDTLRPTMKRVFEKEITKAPITLLSKKLDDQIPTNTDGNNELKKLFKVCPFDYPKPVGLIKYLIRAATYQEQEGFILDFFAGSGTTGDAVLELNATDDFQLKFIIIEMGEYFESILKPRITKKIFSQNWKDGSPESEKNTSNETTQNNIIKYQTLEQYEDTILNIEFLENTQINTNIQDFQIKYMLNFESKESNVWFPQEIFDKPFSSEIAIYTNNGITKVNPDLVETLNYLIGFRIGQIKWVDEQIGQYLILKGYIGQKSAVIIWREKKSGFEPQKEKNFIGELIPNIESFDEIITHGDCLLEFTDTIENLFRKKI